MSVVVTKKCVLKEVQQIAMFTINAIIVVVLGSNFKKSSAH
ncbi:hypothetical protein [Peribacillus asahii]|nr:hypothetical protein [Peribacillus asahii]